MINSSLPTPPWRAAVVYALEFAEDGNLVAVFADGGLPDLVLFSERQRAIDYLQALKDSDPESGNVCLKRFDRLSLLYDEIAGLRPEVRNLLWNPTYPDETSEVSSPAALLTELKSSETTADTDFHTLMP